MKQPEQVSSPQLARTAGTGTNTPGTDAPGMDAPEVLRVLDALDEAGVRYWMAGGWGVAALAGRQTRRHRDLDLAIDADGLGSCLTALGRLGYATETDWLPARIELQAPGERWVDIHPVIFGANGHGRQAGLNDEFFDYPPGAFAIGTVNGHDVPCLSAQQQRHFRTGYEHRPQDIHDLALLQTLGWPRWRIPGRRGRPGNARGQNALPG